MSGLTASVDWQRRLKRDPERVTDAAIHAHDGLLWKQVPGATSTFEELLRAQARWLEISRETDWNPWRKGELAEEEEQARGVMGEWTRAEPDFRPMTKRQVTAMMNAISRGTKAAFAEDDSRWERDKARYDPGLEHARWALLEGEAIVSASRHQREGLASGELFPGMASEKRRQEIAKLDAALECGQAEVARLEALLGDRERVVDEEGRLPSDRRRTNLLYYSIWRRGDIEELQRAIPQLRSDLKVAPKDERSKLRDRLARGERKLAGLLAVPILDADQICAECCTQCFSMGTETRQRRIRAQRGRVGPRG